MERFRLRSLPFGARLGVTGVVLTTLIGLAASGLHLVEQHQNRDGRPGVSLDDLRGFYHGVDAPAPLVTALERSHPPTLAAEERETLLKWLRGGKISEQYDDPDLGAKQPAEIIAKSCASCHARGAKDGGDVGERMPLTTFEDVKKLAFTRSIEKAPTKVLIASTHAHALTLAPLALVLGLLALATRFPQRLTSALACLMGVGLAFDVGGWWLARLSAAWTPVLAVSGAVFAASAGISALLALLDLWLPAPARPPEA